jgi:hypothetical protein
VKEWHTKVLFQACDCLGEGRLGDEQMLCGAVETVVVNDGQKILQLPCVHASSFTVRFWGSRRLDCTPEGGKACGAEAQIAYAYQDAAAACVGMAGGLVGLFPRA